MLICRVGPPTTAKCFAAKIAVLYKTFELCRIPIACCYLVQRQRMPNGKTLPDIKVGNPADSSKVTRATVKVTRRDSDASQGFAAPSHIVRTSSTHDLDSGRIASDRP